MTASLNKKLSDVEWGEFTIGELFEVRSSQKKFDANKVIITDTGFPYVVRTSANNGHRGMINEDPTFLNPSNTISFGQDTATIFYQERPYFTGDKIKVLIPRDARFGKKSAQFLIAAMDKTFTSFSWGSSRFNVATLEDQIVRLPRNPQGVDYNWIESFVAELEAERLAELEAYLKVTGLDSTTLNAEEGGALASFDAIDWQEFSLGYLFDHIEQGKRVKKDDQIPGKIPFVMSGVENRGVVGHISNPVATFPGNSISIDIFGNTFYRKESFGAGDDTGVYWNTTDEFSKLEMLFFSAAIGKSLRGRYSFSNKLRSSRSHDLRVKVPVKDGIIDTDVMQLLINAVQKLVIQGVNDFLMRRVACTQEVITEHANESYRATR